MSPTAAPPALHRALAAAALLALIAVVYAQVRGHGFVNLDDPRYVYENEVVRAGLTLRGVEWAFGGFHIGNWHPLTWLSHMLDVELFGLDAGAHHLVNVAWHAVATLLLLEFLVATTGALAASTLVAALFAVHPLNVESVAWISERKDVLSATAWFLTLCAYARYVRAPTRGRLAAVVLAFALGLLCKPMLVSLPLVLLALDVWPLGRVEAAGWWSRRGRALVLEKLPLLALATASAVVTVAAQRAGGAVADIDAVTPAARLGNAAASVGAYVLDLALPSRLGAFYPHPAFEPGGLSTVQVLVGSAIVAALAAIAVAQARRRPAVSVGIAWFCVTLIPVVGLVQVGTQARADRYTYLPGVGLFVAAVWAARAWAPRGGWLRAASVAAATLVVAAFAWTARAQAATWRDSFTLYEQALRATDGRNWVAWRNLRNAAAQDRLRGDAAYRRLVLGAPPDAGQWIERGHAYLGAANPRAAAECFVVALQLRPGDGAALAGLARAGIEAAEYSKAVLALSQLAARDPQNAELWWSLGIACARARQPGCALDAAERLRALDAARASALLARIRALGDAPPGP